MTESIRLDDASVAALAAALKEQPHEGVTWKRTALGACALCVTLAGLLYWGMRSDVDALRSGVQVNVETIQGVERNQGLLRALLERHDAQLEGLGGRVERLEDHEDGG